MKMKRSFKKNVKAAYELFLEVLLGAGVCLEKFLKRNQQFLLKVVLWVSLYGFIAGMLCISVWRHSASTIDHPLLLKGFGLGAIMAGTIAMIVILHSCFVVHRSPKNK